MAWRVPFSHCWSSASRAVLRASAVSSAATVPEFLLVYHCTTLRRGRGGQTTLQPQQRASAEAPCEPSLSEVHSEMLAALQSRLSCAWLHWPCRWIRCCRGGGQGTVPGLEFRRECAAYIGLRSAIAL